MTPDGFSAHLRALADKIDGSASPSRSAVAAGLRRALEMVSQSPDAVKQWRDTIMEALELDGEVSADSLHEGAEDDADLESAMQALDSLVKEGVLVEGDGVTFRKASGPSKVVVCEYWSLDDAKEVAAELGGTDLREGPYGDIAMLLPVDSVAQLKAEDVMVFDSWLAASADDPEYEFTPVAV